MWELCGAARTTAGRLGVRGGFKGAVVAEVYGLCRWSPGQERRNQACEDTLLKEVEGAVVGGDEGLAARGRVDHREPDWHWGRGWVCSDVEGDRGSTTVSCEPSQRPLRKATFPGQSQW